MYSCPGYPVRKSYFFYRALSYVVRLALPYFSILPINKIIEHKMCDKFLYNLSEIVRILRRILKKYHKCPYVSM